VSPVERALAEIAARLERIERQLAARAQGEP
jgi:hypothetical protein